MLSVSTTTVTGASLSDHELAWSLLDERAGELSERIVLQDLSNGHEQVVVTTPWFRFSDPQAERIRSVSLSGQRIVWTSLVGRAANMMLYDARTKHTIALTHDNTSLAGQIYGDTVAWLTSKSRQPEGTIEILDLRSNHVFTMQGVGFNIQIGNGLVSWTPAYTDVVPLYFVNRRALRFYRPIAKGENIPNVLIFGREVLVPVTTQFGTRSESAAMLHLDVY